MLLLLFYFDSYRDHEGIINRVIKLSKFNINQRMKSSKLVGRYELRIEIAREILARNMNFSPSWLIALLTNKSATQQEWAAINIHQIQVLMDLVGFHCENGDLVRVFEYFDRDGLGVVKCEDFVEFLLPSVRDGLRKAVIKRQATDMEFTFELKHALKRIFVEILKAKSQLKLYEGQFGSESGAKSSALPITKQSLQKFLNKYGKYPTEAQLTLTTNFVVEGRAKQLSYNHLCSIVEESSKEIQYLAENPIVMGQRIQNQMINLKVKELQGSKQVEKILKKGEFESVLNRQLYPRQATAAFMDEFSDKITKDGYRTPSTHGNKAKQEGPFTKSDSIIKGDYENQGFKHPNFKIQRTNSIIHNEQRNLQNQELKRAEELANKLLTTTQPKKDTKENSKQPTPFKKLDQPQPLPQKNPPIYYSSRRKASQPTHSDYIQLMNANTELEQEIERHKLQNQARIKSAKAFLKCETPY